VLEGEDHKETTDNSPVRGFCTAINISLRYERYEGAIAGSFVCGFLGIGADVDAGEENDSPEGARDIVVLGREKRVYE
jgi:hypothetical protein